MKAFLLAISLMVANSALAQDIHITVKGMVCSFCAQGIEKNFKKHKALDSIKVDLENNFVHLKLKPNENILDFEIQKSITDAGYSVEKIERSK